MRIGCWANNGWSTETVLKYTEAVCSKIDEEDNVLIRCFLKKITFPGD